jgi:hypothetical protein
MASISVDVDIDDILWDMTSYEKQELVDELYADGYIPKQMGGVHPDDVPTGDFDREVSKLIGNSWKLSKEDEETILRITNKIIL